MWRNHYKTIILVILIIAVVVLIGFLAIRSMQSRTVVDNNQNDNQPPPKTVVEYKDTQYGFDVKLPDSWLNYTIVTEKWQGDVADDKLGSVAVATGPEILIRHPAWTTTIPRQDIPVMVFTIAQWDDLQQDKFHIGAAPIGPSELGRNANYVFGLPARYNFAFLLGYEEVDQILQGHSFSAF